MATVIIRPVSNYAIQLSCAGATYNWDCVDDVTPDEDTTFVHTDSTSWQRDLYELSDVSFVDTINSVTVWIRCRSTDSSYPVYVRTYIQTYNTEYVGTSYSAPISHTNYSTTYTVNPYTKQPWTLSEVNSLRAGVGIQCSSSKYYGYCTQVYVAIDYTPTPYVKYWTGSAWQAPVAIKYWTGSAWQDVSAVYYWNGSSWVKVW